MNGTSLDSSWKLMLTTVDQIPASLSAIEGSTPYLDVPTLFNEIKLEQQQKQLHEKQQQEKNDKKKDIKKIS